MHKLRGLKPVLQPRPKPATTPSGRGEAARKGSQRVTRSRAALDTPGIAVFGAKPCSRGGVRSSARSRPGRAGTV